MRMNNKKEKKLFSSAVWFMLLDIVLINAAAFLALFVRHELSWSALAGTVYLDGLKAAAVPGTIASVCAFFVFHIYSSMWEFAGDRELAEVGLASIAAAALYTIATLVMQYHMPRSFPFLMAVFLFLLVSGSRFLIRSALSRKWGASRADLRIRMNKKRTMLIGAGSGSAMAIKEFSTSLNSKNQVVCIIDDDKSKHGRRVRGIKVVGGRESIAQAVKKYRVQEIVFCIPSAPVHLRNEILEICSATGAKLKSLPALAQLANGEFSVSQLKDVSIDDLLGRTQVRTDNSVMAERVRGNTVLVTGGGGSIGSELCRQIARHTPKRLVLLDIYENNAYAIEQELHRTHPELDLAVCIGSVRDEMRVSSLFAQYRPDIVFHAAAHKHVPLMEGSPNEAIKNNVFGTLHVAQAADRYGTETFVLISTDKAVNPTNVMGASKRVCEMIVQTMAERSKTKFVAVRFGNVLGSNGSVIPLFRRQIEEGGPVTVTHPDIIRYFMTIPEAVSLVLQAGAYAGRGEIFVLDMGEPVRIDDLARNLIRLSGFEPDVDIEVRYTGLRPGEKLYEEMLMQEEGLRSTPNHLIHIGRPLDIDVPAFERQLTALAAACRENSPAIRTLLAQVVPTYHPEAGGRPAANVS